MVFESTNLNTFQIRYSWVNERSVKYISRITFRNLVLHCYQRFPLNRKNPFPPEPILIWTFINLKPYPTSSYTYMVPNPSRYELLDIDSQYPLIFTLSNIFNYFSCLVWDKRDESDGNQAWSQSFFWHRNTRASPVACYNITHLRPGTLF